MSLREQVRTYLDKFGIKRVHFAKSIGLNQSTFSEWLNDKKEISPYFISKIEKFIEKAKTVEELFDN